MRALVVPILLAVLIVLAGANLWQNHQQAGERCFYTAWDPKPGEAVAVLDDCRGKEVQTSDR